MSELLRVYEPSECDTQGVPLDWERCRACRGSGGVQPPKAGWPDAQDGTLAAKYGFRTCPTCGGHGSLKAAALAVKHEHAWRVGDHGRIRCEDCGHPMSEGEAWEPDPVFTSVEDRDGFLDRVAGRDFEYDTFVHYSPCDKGCRHGGPVRADSPSDFTKKWENLPGLDADAVSSIVGATAKVEASWRPVDIRTLGWPCDLRPDNLAVLCLRCFVERGT